MGKSMTPTLLTSRAGRAGGRTVTYHGSASLHVPQGPCSPHQYCTIPTLLTKGRALLYCQPTLWTLTTDFAVIAAGGTEPIKSFPTSSSCHISNLNQLPRRWSCEHRSASAVGQSTLNNGPCPFLQASSSSSRCKVPVIDLALPVVSLVYPPKTGSSETANIPSCR